MAELTCTGKHDNTYRYHSKVNLERCCTDDLARGSHQELLNDVKEPKKDGTCRGSSEQTFIPFPGAVTPWFGDAILGTESTEKVFEWAFFKNALPFKTKGRAQTTRRIPYGSKILECLFPNFNNKNKTFFFHKLSPFDEKLFLMNDLNFCFYLLCVV